jgi:hypothetical protein
MAAAAIVQPQAPGCNKKFTVSQSVMANLLIEVLIMLGVCWYLESQNQMVHIFCCYRNSF